MGWMNRGGQFRIEASLNFGKCMRRRSAAIHIGPGADGGVPESKVLCVVDHCSRGFSSDCFSREAHICSNFSAAAFRCSRDGWTYF